MKVPLCQVQLSDKEISYAEDALNTGWISGTGAYVEKFERAVAAKVERERVVAVSSGTTALHLALLALDIGPGDEVIVPALTFVSPAAVVKHVGGRPVFADIAPNSWTLDTNHVRRLINDRTKAIIAVDLLGHPCDYEELSRLGVTLIEDAAQAHGARYRSKPVGSFGRMSTFSFHANKAVCSGEGGCVATDDHELADHMRLITNHGMSPQRPYWHDVVGHNFRMTNVTAAIGLGQVERWEQLVAARNQVAEAYRQGLADQPLQPRPVAEWADEACWMYTVTSSQRERLLQRLRRRGVDARAIWPALPDLPIYADSACGDYEVARRIAAQALWLPTWTNMPDATVSFVIDAVKQAQAEE